MYTLTVKGQLNVVDPDTSDVQVTYTFDDLVQALSGLTQLCAKLERSIMASDGNVALALEGITALKTFVMFVSGGSVTLKHDANATGAVVSDGGVYLVVGSIGNVVISTSSTTPVKVKYAAFG